MSVISGVSVIAVPPTMAVAVAKLVVDYAAVTGQEEREVRRLVEIAVLTRGVRAMQAEVEEQRKLAERMGWT